MAKRIVARRKTLRKAAAGAGLLTLLLLPGACGGSPPPSPPPAAQAPAAPGPGGAKTAGKNVPADHNKEKGGFLHKPGLKDPQSNCASCHGADLRGGKPGTSSCYQCHDKNWH